MHWLVSQRKMLLCFDFKKEAFKATPLPEMVKGRRRGHLINLKGSLAIVDVSLHLLSEKKQVNIWVMKSYETSEWERIYSIEIHTEVHWKTLIQLGACPGSVGVWDHGIFFKNVYSESQSIVFFLHLENGNTCIRALKAGSASIMYCGDGLAQVGFGVFSYSGSLISLRNICGSNLIEAAEKKCDFFRVAKMQRSILPRYAEEWQHCVLSSKLVQVGS